MKKTITEELSLELAKLLAPLKQLVSPKEVTAFVHELGWRLPEDQELNVDLVSLVSLIDELDDILSDFFEARTDEETLEELEKLIIKIPEVIATINTVAPRIVSAIESIHGFVGETIELGKVFPRRFLDYLLYQYLLTYHYKIYAVLHILGIVEIVVDNHNIPVKTVHWQRISQVLSEPLTVAQDVYQWNDDIEQFDGNEFLRRCEIFLRAFLLPGGIYRQAGQIRAQFGRIEAGDAYEIRMPLYQTGTWPESYMELDLNLSPIPPNGEKKSGLILYPYVYGDLNIEEEISEDWSFDLKGNADLGAGLGLELRPPTEVMVRSNLLTDPLESVDAHLELGITKRTPGGELNLIFGSEDGSRLGFKELGFNLYLAMERGEYTIAGEVEIEDFTLVIDAGDGDGFIQKILSGIRLESVNDLVIGVSNKEGFYFRGSSALSITIPINKELGPITLNSVLIGIGFGDEVLVILAVSFGVQLGPIAGSVKNIGIQLPLSFPEDGDGNLGPIDVKGIEFLPPAGAGLAVDAGGITGGGYLEFDKVNERYAGILELNFGEIGLVAIGLITTRMPDGSKGFSMLIIICVEFNPVIQLSFGFTLSAVGGLIGINRQANTDFLREGLRAKTLDSILFPENPIANADMVISNLRNAFPTTEGRFIVGPMVKIGWGSPNIITADICVLLELPSPVRIILLGQIEAKFPEAEEAIVEINLDVLGVLDFSKKSLALDATIYDSRILTFTLTGDAALRLNWGDKPDFAMSLGGWHPKYTPPPAFPSLRRLTLSLSSGKNLQLSCKVYQALTANTLQFGSNITLYAKFGGVTVDGHLGFDTLFYFSPFSFLANMRAGVSVKYRGHRLASVRLMFDLSGPTPWHACGEATFSILRWDVSVDFDKTWGPRRTARLDSVNPWEPLHQALLRDEGWGSAVGMLQPVENFLSAKPTDRISGNGTADEQRTAVLIHPAGGVEVRENVLPMNTTLKTLGNAPVKTYNRFEVKSISSDENGGSSLEDWSYVDEYFARAQYESVSDSKKLSLPSFEKMSGGIKVGGSDVLQISAAIESQELNYESILIDDDGIVVQPVGLAVAKWDEARFHLIGAMQNVKAQSGNKRFHQKDVESVVAVQEESCVIVDRDSLEQVEHMNGAGGLSRTAADQTLERSVAEKPEDAGQYMVISASELVGD